MTDGSRWERDPALRAWYRSHLVKLHRRADSTTKQYLKNPPTHTGDNHQ